MLKAQRIKNGILVPVTKTLKIRADVLSEDIIRIRAAGIHEDFSPSALVTYGFIKTNWKPSKYRTIESRNAVRLVTPRISVTISSSPFRITFRDIKGTRIAETASIELLKNGYINTMRLDKHERFFGFGDQARNTIEHRGRTAHMQVTNVESYVPIPFFMSTNGYGIFTNTTWKHSYDMGASSKKNYFWKAAGGRPDYYFIYGPGMDSILDNYTMITGKPSLPPKWSFGLWFICRENENDNEVLNDCINFRRERIPCDIIGLEPGWMSKYYDYSIDKQWDENKFYHQSWRKEQGPIFIQAMKKLGFKLELWLCNNYDLSYEADKSITVEKSSGYSKQAAFVDPHLAGTSVMDRITHPGIPWFDHLKKFVDQGADLFKHDGADQVLPHHDRKWANGMTDDEMHNLYPLLYSKQMYEGFLRHTGKRPCGFTAAGWSGLQRYTGTWTGDTGGGPGTITACINNGLCAHPFTTCDMDVESKESIHAGFLLPWAQLNSWAYYKHPCFLHEDMKTIFREYALLRYSLIPYLYSYAYESYRTGMPVIRAMPLEFPQDTTTHKKTRQYMLGRELMVTTFTKNVYLPQGTWIDYWTGREYKGFRNVTLQIPENRGGGLLVRKGAILPKAEPMDYIGHHNFGTVILEIFPDTRKSSFTLYEDDGISQDYTKGKCSKTLFECRINKDAAEVSIGKRNGSYKGMPKKRSYRLQIHTGTRPSEVTVNGKPVNTWDYNNASLLLTVHTFPAHHRTVISIT